MIAHTGIPVSDYQKSKAFYTKVLKVFGYTNNMEFGVAAGFNDGTNTDFWISQETKMAPVHVAFSAKSEQEVQDFYKVALEAGAKDNGAPGYRSDYGAGYYAAFVHDPDGHNIEAMYWNPHK
jgi:predicted lactoylglutathione lyase